MQSKYSYRRVGTTGCEVVDLDGFVVAWTVDDVLAALICRLLNTQDRPGSAVDAGATDLPQVARCHMGVSNSRKHDTEKRRHVYE